MEILSLKGYDIHFSKSEGSFLFALLKQFPNAKATMNDEKKWLDDVIEQKGIDVVISDDRPGLYSQKIPSVYVTHQLQIKAGNKPADVVASRVHQKLINHFSNCWVPDVEGNELAGELSKPANKIKIPIDYIGPQSRMQQLNVDEDVDWLFLFSGPEPSRTNFEHEIIKIVPQLNGKIEIVRGQPNGNEIPQITDNITIHHHLPANELNKKMLAAKRIVARGGYSTIMDLAALKKTAILIPTPGQTEQEYLGSFLSSKKYFNTINEKELYKIPSMKFEENKLPDFPNNINVAIEKLLSSI